MKSHFKDLKGKNIAIWGTAFKANTDDIRETPAQYIVEELTKEGASVTFFDPEAAENFEKMCEQNKFNAKKVTNKYDCLNNADALCVLTEWKEFRTPDLSEIKSRLKTPILFDGRNLYRTDKVLAEGFTYFAVGKAI